MTRQSSLWSVNGAGFAEGQGSVKGGDLLKADPEASQRWAPAKPTVVFDAYWRFAAERQRIFFNRLREASPPWTDDPILRQYRFTNTYRILDRVSQFLVRKVIYTGPGEPAEAFFRTILFKLFNKIETWHLLAKELGEVTWADYSFSVYDKVLTRALQRGQRIYSAAYMMPAGRHEFGYAKKHRNHLRLVEQMMGEGLPLRLAEARSMREAFELLKTYPTIGDFLAYQFATDINYGELTDFSEMEFVVPGPGARDGIHKCFRDLGGLNEAELIKRVADRQEEEFRLRGIDFPCLLGRPLQLIDCQNLFCEVDKYARVAYPEVRGLSGRTRIKQLFRPNPDPVEYWFPPKWQLNGRLTELAFQG